MNPQVITAIADTTKTLATLWAICWCVGRLLKYWEARLPHFGAEPMPGVGSVTRKAQVDVSE